MKDQLTDNQLVQLINLCKMTGNYKKIGITGFMLLSNLADKFGVKLGLELRNKFGEEQIHTYLERINERSSEKLEITLIKTPIIVRIKGLETTFHSEKGTLTLNQIKTLFEIYYELRKINLPALLQKVQDKTDETNNVPMLFFSKFGKATQQNKPKVDILLDYIIKKEEEKITRQLHRGADPELLEKKLEIQKFRKQMINSSETNASFRIPPLLRNSFLGLMLICLLFGVLLLIEAIMNPFLTQMFGLLTFGLFGLSAMSYLLYKRKGET